MMTLSSPIQPHPVNPRYFSWDGKALALISSTEHFGGAINLDFDYHSYLRTLAAHNFTLTQVWTGAYVEPDSDAGRYNTLDPRCGHFIAPWQRVPSAIMEKPCRNGCGCGHRFDLNRPENASFFERLVGFVHTAAQHNIVVEVGLFGGYEQTHESIWRVVPFNPANNVNLVKGSVNRTTVFSLGAPAELLEAQAATVKAVASALLNATNCYFQLVNRGDYAHPAWGQRMLKALREIDPVKMVAIPYAWAGAFSGAGLVNYVGPDAVPARARQPTRAPLMYDESGGLPDVCAYRRSYWAWMLSGGGGVDNLDWSFAVGHERGTLPAHLCHEAPNAGPDARAALRALSWFFKQLPFVQMVPNANRITAIVPKALPRESVHALFVQTLYHEHRFFGAGLIAVADVRTVGLHLEESCVAQCPSVIVEWLETTRIAPIVARASVPSPTSAGKPRVMAVPAYRDDIAFRLLCESRE